MADPSSLDATSQPSPNSWEDGRGEEEVVEFSAETEPPRGLFGVSALEFNRDDDTAGDGTSRASSAHSMGTDSAGDGEYERLRAMVRLGLTHCRVSCRINGTPGCCGNPRDTCTRRGHQAKPESARGRPGVYEPLARNSRGHTDARWPPGGVPSLTFDDHTRLVTELRAERENEISALIDQEMAGAYAGVGLDVSEDDDDDEPRATVTFEGVAATPQTRNYRREHQAPARGSQPNTSPGGRSYESFHTARDREGGFPAEWYGIVKVVKGNSKPWKLVDNLEALAQVLDGSEDLEMGPTFPTYSAAKTWFVSGLRSASRDTGNSNQPSPAPARNTSTFPQESSAPSRPPSLVTTKETTVKESFPHQCYCGFTREGERALAFTTEQQTLYLKANWICSTVFTDLPEAQRWLNEGTKARTRIDLTGSPVSPDQTSPRAPEVDPQSGVTPSLNYGGPDPSTGNEHELYGLSVADWNGLQVKMVPEGMSPRDAVLMVGEAADPCACPGRGGHSLSVDAESQLSTIMDTVVDSMVNWTEAQNERDGRGRQRWSQSVQNKALEEIIKDPTKIGQLILDFDEMWPYEEENQNLSWRAHLSRLGYSDRYVTQWLATGLLPTLIRQTKTWHRAMLQAVQSDAIQFPTIPWDDGNPVRGILQGFVKRVSFCRQACKYRANFIAQIYIHYREAARRNFGRDRVLTALLHSMQNRALTGGDTGSPRNTGEATPAASRYCSHCGGSRTVHPPNACPYTKMPKVTVKRLFGSMNASDRNAVLPIFRKLEDQDPSGSHVQHLEAAIREVRGPAGG